MGRYEVKYIENGVEKTSEKFADRDEAFAFQSGLLAKRQRKANGAWDIEPVGVYDLTPVGG